MKITFHNDNGTTISTFNEFSAEQVAEVLNVVLDPKRLRYLKISNDVFTHLVNLDAVAMINVTED